MFACLTPANTDYTGCICQGSTKVKIEIDTVEIWKKIKGNLVIVLVRVRRYVTQNKKKFIVASLVFIASPLFYYAYRAYITTTYYCIDRYATYKELKKKHRNDLKSLQAVFVKLAEKYNEEDHLKGYIVNYIWRYKKKKWYFNPQQHSYASGNQNISDKIKYVNEPCKSNFAKRRITCKIGTYRTQFFYSSYTQTWSTTRTLLDGNFEKTVLNTYPHFGNQRDVDVCYVKGSYSPFQSKNLHEASAYGHIHIVKKLIAKGRDVNKQDETSLTPLHYASENGHSETVKLLLENGADLKSTTKEGKTPLQLAIKNGHRKTVKLLRASAKVEL